MFNYENMSRDVIRGSRIRRPVAYFNKLYALYVTVFAIFFKSLNVSSYQLNSKYNNGRTATISFLEILSEKVTLSYVRFTGFICVMVL